MKIANCLLTYFFCICLSAPLWASPPDSTFHFDGRTPDVFTHVVYATAGGYGPGGIAGIGYERIFKSTKGMTIAGGLHLDYLSLFNSVVNRLPKGKRFYWGPLTTYVAFGFSNEKRIHNFETRLNISLMDTETIFRLVHRFAAPSLSLGYRIQNPAARVFFRVWANMYELFFFV